MKSLKGLARRLCVPLDVLQELAQSIDRQYRTFPSDPAGANRPISEPSDRLKSVQRRIYKEFLKPLLAPAHLHGCVPGRSPLTNAQVHAEQSWLLRVDVKKFFPSISPRHVYAVWIDHVGCSPPVASLLTRLTTFKFSLPQGAPTSPALANLVLANVDREILERAKKDGSRYTRYVDDLAISGNDPRYLVQDVIALLQHQGFKISRKKLNLMPCNRPQEITGYGTNSARLSRAKKHRDRVRAAIHGLGQLEPQSREYQDELRSIEARIRHLRKTNPGPARRLELYLQGTLRRPTGGP